MTLTQYETFLEVVKTGSMSRAAHNLHQTVPGVSYAITKLEEEWGIALFNRSRNQLRITDEGRMMAQYAMAVMDAQRRLEEGLLSIKGGSGGTVRVGGLRWAGKLWLPGIMSEMKKDYPGIDIKIVLNLYEDIKKDLMGGELDVAFAQEPEGKSLNFIYLVDDPYMAAVRKGHPLAEKDRVCLGELREPLILPDWEQDRRMHELIQRSGITDKVAFYIKDTGTMVSMAAHGMGIAIMPAFLLADSGDEADMVLLSDWPARRMGLVTAGQKQPSPAAAKFIEYTKRWVEEHVKGEENKHVY